MLLSCRVEHLSNVTQQQNIFQKKKKKTPLQNMCIEGPIKLTNYIHHGKIEMCEEFESKH